MTTQTILACLAVLGALAYVVRATRRAWAGDGSCGGGCSGCGAPAAAPLSQADAEAERRRIRLM